MRRHRKHATLIGISIDMGGTDGMAPERPSAGHLHPLPVSRRLDDGIGNYLSTHAISK